MAERGEMKVTKEQFVKLLGIELEQEFKWNGTDIKYRISKCYEVELFSHHKNMLVESASTIRDLLDFEITPLPKYTLTDDEKAIVRNIKGEYTIMARNDYWGLHLKDTLGTIHLKLPFPDLFWFVKTLDSVSLDELRKYL